MADLLLAGLVPLEAAVAVRLGPGLVRHVAPCNICIRRGDDDVALHLRHRHRLAFLVGWVSYSITAGVR